MSAPTIESTARKVGDPVWIFDENRRTYVKGQSGPVWKLHWIKKEIRAETSRSWIVGEGWDETKIPKKGEQPRGIAWSEEEIDRRAYVHDNAHKIADKVRWVKDYDTLKAIAALIDRRAPSTESE